MFIGYLRVCFSLTDASSIRVIIKCTLYVELIDALAMGLLKWKWKTSLPPALRKLAFNIFIWNA